MGSIFTPPAASPTAASWSTASVKELGWGTYYRT
ncbi:hypothetical protein LINGRAHAP2_LOCUS22495 [Linum grandiflorum]